MNPDTLKIAVVGTGGVGGYFGGVLSHSGADVRFLARGRHLAALQASGLHVRTPEGGFTVPASRIAASTSDIGPVDVVLFCVKSYDTEEAARQMGPLLKPDTLIIPLQNGIESAEHIASFVRSGVVLGGVAYIYATVTAPGVVTEGGGPRKIVFGPASPLSIELRKRAEAAQNLMISAGIGAEFTDAIRDVIWKKFIFITAVGGITALTRLTLGEILSVPQSRSLLLDAMHETMSVALASGATIEHDHLATTFDKLRGFDNATRSSLYHDLVHGRRMELDALSGTVVRRGESLGISTPVHRVIYAALLPYHLNSQRQTP